MGVGDLRGQIKQLTNLRQLRLAGLGNIHLVNIAPVVVECLTPLTGLEKLDLIAQPFDAALVAGVGRDAALVPGVGRCAAGMPRLRAVVMSARDVFAEGRDIAHEVSPDWSYGLLHVPARGRYKANVYSETLHEVLEDVLHGESSKRLALPRITKDRKHLQSTQSTRPTHLTDQAPSTIERTARETHNTK